MTLFLVEGFEEPVDDEGLEPEKFDVVCASAWAFNVEVEPPDEELGESKSDGSLLGCELGQDLTGELAQLAETKGSPANPRTCSRGSP